ncbi:DUF421 domain-containing protein [Bacillus sp. JJ1609]|uniref:DUF421 domain-containing protein n=1 Tax=Bacillus sp. JJ1609 TaxID=3122977 RepID=UPI002FFD7B72
MVYPLLAVKLAFGLAALVIVTRLLGKKEMSQVTPFDFVYAIVLGGLVEENLFKKSPSSILEMLFGIAVWALLIFIVDKTTQKSDKLKPILKGTAKHLIKDGKILIKNLEEAELEMEQLSSLLRLKGVFSIKDVKEVILETSGDISVLLKAGVQPVTYEGLDIKPPKMEIPHFIVDEGKPVRKGLEKLGKDENWLYRTLKEYGVNDISKIYFAEWSETEGFYIQLCNSTNKNKTE